eukprot:2319380-Pyramimonas_sp.AAC.1
MSYVLFATLSCCLRVVVADSTSSHPLRLLQSNLLEPILEPRVVAGGGSRPTIEVTLGLASRDIRCGGEDRWRPLGTKSPPAD